MMEQIKNMSPEKIKDELKKREITAAGIARELDKTPTSIHLVISGKSVSHKIRSYIAECIEKPVENVWPETYLLKPDPTKKGRPMTKGHYAY